MPEWYGHEREKKPETGAVVPQRPEELRAGEVGEASVQRFPTRPASLATLRPPAASGHRRRDSGGHSCDECPTARGLTNPCPRRDPVWDRVPIPATERWARARLAPARRKTAPERTAR